MHLRIISVWGGGQQQKWNKNKELNVSYIYMCNKKKHGHVHRMIELVIRNI
jgi:hypothetical protein